jgi:ATP-binding cassette subfamily B protein
LASRLLRFLQPYRKEVVWSVLLLAAISLLEIAGPYLTKVAIDTYVKPMAGHAAPLPEATRGLLLIALGYVGVLVAAFALRYVQTYVLSMVGQRAMQDLRLSIFRHLGTLSASYYDTRPVGRILRSDAGRNGAQRIVRAGVVAVIGDIFL